MKVNATAKSAFKLGDPDPTVSSGYSDGKVRHLHFKEELCFDQASIRLSYKARFDQTKDDLISEQMTVQGKHIDLSEGRIFVVDMTVDPVHCQQVNLKLPSTEEIDFLSSNKSQYKSFTKRWITELAKNSDVVSKTFSP